MGNVYSCCVVIGILNSIYHGTHDCSDGVWVIFKTFILLIAFALFNYS